MSTLNALKTILVWDIPTRLFHWSLALLFGLQFVTGSLGDDWLVIHSYLGYTTLVLIVFRIFWGIWGGHWSRFSSFFPAKRASPPSITDGHPVTQTTLSPGHTWLGSLSITVILLSLLAQIISGLMTNDDVSFAGPFVKRVSNDVVDWMGWYHTEVGYYLLLFLATLHICAIAYYQIIGINLIKPMLDGYKTVETPGEVSTVDTIKKRLFALTLLALSALLVFLLLLLA
jgi:cytochrome b